MIRLHGERNIVIEIKSLICITIQAARSEAPTQACKSKEQQSGDTEAMAHVLSLN